MATPCATATSTDLDKAYAHCERLARSHYENFTVGSILLPRAIRPHFFAVYAFCRHTDDLGDEAPGDRLALLEKWEAQLDKAYDGSPSEPIMQALQDTIRRFKIPDTPFRRLIHANRMDQDHVRFPTYRDVLHYCKHSAEPVGHMVLYLTGDKSERSHELSDATCTALQLANFLQDVRRDYEKGRIYLPLEDMEWFGYSEEELRDGVVNEAFRRMMSFEVDRAVALFKKGYALVDRVRGRYRLDIALFTKGGLSVLEAIRAQNYDVLSKRPVVRTGRKIWLLALTAGRMTAGLRP